MLTPWGTVNLHVPWGGVSSDSLSTNDLIKFTPWNLRVWGWGCGSVGSVFA